MWYASEICTSQHRLNQCPRFKYLWCVGIKYSTKRFITISFPLELLSFLVMIFHCFAEYLTQLATSYKEKCKQIMPIYPGFTLQNAKASSWLNASKGNDPIREKFPFSSFNMTEYIQFLGQTAPLIDLKITFVMLLLLILPLDRSKEKAILCMEHYFLYMVFWSYSGVVKNKNLKTSPKPNPVYMHSQMWKLHPHWKDYNYFKFWTESNIHLSFWSSSALLS